jgi:putative ABC transport system permease protein
MMLERLVRNVRYAIKALARTPSFTLTIVLTLALGIGATSAMFSAVDAILLRPLPYPSADRLLALRQAPGEGLTAPIRIEDWNRLNATFEAIAGYGAADVADTTGSVPERVRRATVSPRFFDVWGVAPAMGRGFEATEHHGAPSAAVITDRYWHVHMGADPDVLGKTIRIAGESLAIVGVMPATFLFPDREVDVFTATSLDGAYENYRGASSYWGVGRLRSDVTPQQAQADLNRVQTQLAAEFPDTDRAIRCVVEPLKASVLGGVGATLWLLFGAVTALLLIACTNISALLLARATRREHEIALRFSLGATRGVVAAELLVEAGVLVVAGAAAGVFVAAAAGTAFAKLAPHLARVDEIGVDARLLAYAFALAVPVLALCGLLSVRRGARDTSVLPRAGHGQIRGNQALQWGFVGLQVALSVTLLVGAGLLLRSLDALARVDPGFDASHVLTFRMTASWDENRDYGAIVERMNRTLDELAAVPGVEAAATTYVEPGVPSQWESEFSLVGAAAAETPMIAAGDIASPGFFAAMQIPIAAGELCRRPTDDWRPGAKAELMVNRRFADRYLGGGSALGLELTSKSWGIMSSGRIVGVVEDARERGLDRAPVPTVYLCLSMATPFPIFLARTRGEPLAAVGAIRARLAEVEPSRSLYEVMTLEERIGGAFAENRLRTILLTVFAATALALTCLGLYGTLSYVVGLRQREMGLRVALGARQRDIVLRHLKSALLVVASASVAGLAMYAGLVRVLASMLYGVSPLDPTTLVGVVLVVLAVTGVAALLPALRASRADPTEVLKGE